MPDHTEELATIGDLRRLQVQIDEAHDRIDSLVLAKLGVTKKPTRKFSLWKRSQ